MSLIELTNIIDCQISNENIKYIRQLIDTADNLLKNARTLRFTQEGLSLEAMQGGSVFVSVNIKKDYFSKYKVTKEALELCFSLTDLKKALSRPVKSEEEHLVLTFTDGNKFIIAYKKGKGKNKRTYEIPLHNPEEKDDEHKNMTSVIKSIPLACEIIAPAGTLKSILDDIKIATEKDEEKITIKVDHNGAFFTAKKDIQTLSGEVEIPTNDPDVKIKLAEESVLATYDMTSIDNLVKLEALSEKTVIELGTDKPLRITFFVHEKIEFVFVLAPLVEDEDEEDDEDSSEDDSDDD